MTLIVAVDQNWGIGKNNGLLFRIPEDMAFFRETTTGKVIVMGRKTLESFPGGKPLKNRTNIVLTTRPGLETPDVIACSSLAQLAKLLDEYGKNEIFVAGGENVYRQLLPYCDTALVTKVNADGDAAKFFPNLDEIPGWELSSQTETRHSNGYDFTICEYHNNSVKPMEQA